MDQSCPTICSATFYRIQSRRSRSGQGRTISWYRCIHSLGRSRTNLDKAAKSAVLRTSDQIEWHTEDPHIEANETNEGANSENHLYNVSRRTTGPRTSRLTKGISVNAVQSMILRTLPGFTRIFIKNIGMRRVASAVKPKMRTAHPNPT